MQKKYTLLIFLAALFLINAGAVFAQDETATTENTAITPEETITISDLGVEEPKILPTSPFYFFKELGRNLKGLVTFNAVSRAELELKVANEKAAEMKKVLETQPNNAQAIQKALENYQSTQEKLRKKLEGLSEASQNPKVDALLNNLTEKVVKHEKLFDEIAFKFKGEEQVSNAVQTTMSESENIMGETSKNDDPAKFASRLEKVLLGENGGDLKNARSVEIIDKFSNKATPEIKESLGRLREEFSEKLEQDLQNLVNKEGDSAVKEKIINTPGDIAARSLIIEEIQKRAEENLSQALEKAMSKIETMLQNEADINQKATEQIERAGEMIRGLEKKIQDSETAKISSVVSTLLTEAREHLENAKSAFEEEKYGEAFGQAKSAEVLARNALKFFEEEKPEKENFERQLKELEEKISIYENLIKGRELTQEQNENTLEILDNNASLQLERAKESLANGNLEATKTDIDYIKKTILKFSNILERKTTSVSPQGTQIQQAQPIRPTQIFPSSVTPAASLCEDIQKKIISLKESLASGELKESDFESDYNNILRELIICQETKNASASAVEPSIISPTQLPKISPTPLPVTTNQNSLTVCTLEYDPVCGSDKKTYSNPCLAKNAGVETLYLGECESPASPQPTIESAKPLEQNQTQSVSPNQ